MPESNKHKFFVERVDDWIKQKYPDIKVYKDLPDEQDIIDRPPLIEKSIPDIYASDDTICLALVGEAKTRSMRESRSFEQIKLYLNYLKNNKAKNKLFILALPYVHRGEARYYLHFLNKDMELYSVDLFILDEHEEWNLNHLGKGVYKWRLIC